MKTLLACIAFLSLAAVSARAGDVAVSAAVRSADSERVSATPAADGARLNAILSDSLRYVHSSGHVDSKATYIQELTSHAMVYVTYEYQEQIITPVAPTIALMAGRVAIGMKSAAGVKPLDINYLAVWREEGGSWKLLSWQSSRIPQPST